jgi:2-polyprenyl-3-methyl-5-hydroxy-6-metoxy-1,4-benzoquinol methylase
LKPEDEAARLLGMTQQVDTRDLVAEQYEAYPYPPYADSSSLDPQKRLLGDPSITSIQLWPEGRLRDDLRILSAGCGTRQAAMVAHANPNCSVLGIDLSETSLANQAALRDQYRLTNLELKQMSLFDIGSLNRQFDYIMCTGVLMCLPDPDRGLKALADVLDPHGRMSILLYAKTGRAGVYFIQEAMRKLGLTQNGHDVATAREFLKAAPKDHFVHSYIQKVEREIASDAGFVDSFLHPQDIAHSVADIMEFLDRAGLCFAGWAENGHYYPDRFLSGDLLKRIQERPLVDQWTAIENLFIPHIKHEFYVCKPGDKKHLITFDDPAWPSFVPHLQNSTTASGNNAQTWKIWHRDVTSSLNATEAFIVTQIDGKRRISDIIKHQNLAKNPYPQRLQFAREFFSRMWRLGHLIYSKGCKH